MDKPCRTGYESPIPKIHDIWALLTQCKELTDTLHIDKKIAVTITDFAVITRYIEDRRDFTEDTAKFALKQATFILDMIKKFLYTAYRKGADNRDGLI